MRESVDPVSLAVKFWGNDVKFSGVASVVAPIYSISAEIGKLKKSGVSRRNEEWHIRESQYLSPTRCASTKPAANYFESLPV